MSGSSYEYNRAWKAKRRQRGLTAEGRPYKRGPYKKAAKGDDELDRIALRDSAIGERSDDHLRLGR